MTIKFTRRSVCALGAAALGCAAFPPFAAEDPIRIIVPYPPGGPLDVTARAVAEEARHDLGNIIVENKPGAGGNADTSKPGTAGTETLSKTGAQTLLLAVTACIMLAAGFSITTARSRRR